MFTKLKEPFGKAGLIVAMFALVMALVGGAYAANNGKRHHKKKNNAGLNGKQKKQVRNISKSQAKKFANSNPGPAGPQGPAGSNGDKGDKGDTGATGKQGIQGPAGANGTFSTEPLPSGETLKGVWTASNPSASGSGVYLSVISFPLQLASAPTTLVPFAGGTQGRELLDETVAGFGPFQPPTSLEELEANEEAYDEACPGTVDEPDAGPGFLCIYEGAKFGTGEFTTAAAQSETASEFGIAVPWGMNAGRTARGTWAVTAAE